MKRKVKVLSAMSIYELETMINDFYKDRHSDHWHVVSINEGDNRSHIAWMEEFVQED